MSGTSSSPVPRDPGLQPERTALAWQRSALTLAGASVIVARLTITTAGFVAVFAAASGLVHAAVLSVEQRRGYQARLSGSAGRRWPIGVHAALLAAQVVLLSAIELWHLLHQR